MTYWMVIYSEKTRDFFNDNHYVPDDTWTQEAVIQDYEQKYEGYKVIHAGTGDKPPKTYRSLPYMDKSFKG